MDDFTYLTLVNFLILEKKRERKQRQLQRQLRSFRIQLSDCNIDLHNLMFTDQSGFKTFCGLLTTEFEALLNLVGSQLKEPSDGVFVPTPEEKLALTLRFLTTGDSFYHISYQFNLSEEMISTTVLTVCEVINAVFSEQSQIDKRAEAWINISDEFESQWNFPHCIGALDGRCILLDRSYYPPPLNDEHVESFYAVMLGIVDANYKIVDACFAAYKLKPDGSVFGTSNFSSDLFQGKLNLPQKTPLEGRQKELPYVLVTGKSFPLSEHVMKPYAGHFEKGSKEHIFNYRLGRVQSVAENALGVMSFKFRIFGKPVPLEPERALVALSACAHLHNFLRSTFPASYLDPSMLDREEDGMIIKGAWRNDISAIGYPLKPVNSTASNATQNIRNEFANYFSANGYLPLPHYA